MIQMDPRRLKFKISQNRTKPVPLHRAHRADSDHICFFQKWALYVEVIAI
jgi:hypothetical protein